MNEAIDKIKAELLQNLDAQLHTLRYRCGANTVLVTSGIEHELTAIKRILRRITQLHEVANTLNQLRQKGVNAPLDASHDE